MPFSHFSNPEGQAFYQRRVALFGLSLAAAGALALVFRIAVALWSGTLAHKAAEPSLWLHLAGIAPCVAMWLICRRGRLRLTQAIAVETSGLLATSVAFIGMGMTIPPEVGADAITAFTLSFAFFSRAVFVPSTARQTAILGLLVGVPLVAMMTWHYLDVDAEMWRRVGYDTRGFDRDRIAVSTALMTVMWWTLTVGLASLASRLIHRLRSEVQTVQRLGQYHLEQKLGEGSMGVVYQATHGMLKRPTAVKLLRPELGDERVLDRFRSEVQQTAKLTHPHTVKIYDYGRTPEGLFYYAMELLDGASLQDIVDATGAQPVRRVVRILRDVALALDEAHAIGLIHRDIKPGNIMLAKQGRVHDVVKVLDFGLVKHMKDLEDPEQTDLRMIRGTPRYISPEAIEDPRGVDPRSDLYALGAVGYCLLAGRPVFDGSSVFQICLQHVQSTPIPLREVCPSSVPEELERLILSCLEKSKHDRPGSAQALADALDRIDLPPWTRADAQRWWELHGELVMRQRQSAAPPITGQTMDPPGARPWYESG
jgi:serine/threonine-protein kinase